ncbi:MAG: hypothetical protein LBK23_07360 [Oscillospiraceae bacterium]|nr:hypothetical protein [Oscillospiraceae bacterium]
MRLRGSGAPGALGSFADVKITGCNTWSLTGELAQARSARAVGAQL